MLDHPLELTGLRADGTEFPVEVAIRRLELPGPPLFTGYIRDVTDRRAAEAALRRLADEQAALRRVAMLVAAGAERDAVFAAVTEEVGRALDAQTREPRALPRRRDGAAWSAPGATARSDHGRSGMIVPARRRHGQRAYRPHRPPGAGRLLRRHGRAARRDRARLRLPCRGRRARDRRRASCGAR